MWGLSIKRRILRSDEMTKRDQKFFILAFRRQIVGLKKCARSVKFLFINDPVWLMYASMFIEHFM